MSESLPIHQASAHDDLAVAHQWLAQVLTNFAKAEQAIGRLCIGVSLPIKNGPLGSVNELRNRLSKAEDRRCKNLEKRIERWQSLRPVRHVLAHATVRVLFDENRNAVIVTRHLPRDEDDVTPDRIWSAEESLEVLRIASNDGRSIHDQVQNLLNDKKVIAQLRKP
ncbi:hypothetical protein [Porphyrobacter sp. AAP60]|uniref:hypothetical protein n=1 Tax=Porphyrobacter sp. AAP60 TaxID=1523423 RepID=UPI0006B88CB6|nr:hypothetical protein [Porphyrobacter sp. AAP60]KPF63888.1 hypothetical protein IP79_08730 [Porphyrobacter sp. AAP60]